MPFRHEEGIQTLATPFSLRIRVCSGSLFATTCQSWVDLPQRLKLYWQLNRLLASISEPITIDGVSVSITASMGVTEFPQPMDIMGEQLLRQAQQALFQSKLQGKGRLHQYDIALEQDARALTGHLEDIQSALHAGEFVLYYQPKINMTSGAVFGYGRKFGSG